MPLTQQHVDELKAIHKADFGEDLSDEEAWEMGTNLVNLFRLLLTADRLKENKAQSNAETPEVPLHSD